MKSKIVKYVLMCFVVVVGIVWYIAVGRAEESDEHTFEVKEQQVTEVYNVSESTGTYQNKVVVYVCGEVNNPGVYTFDEGSRIIDIIEAAGGFSNEAAMDFLNLARPLKDGEMIMVPSVREVEEGSVEEYYTEKANDMMESAATDALCININTATKEELMELPGIGENKALNIISYREENGKFNTIEEIMLVSGIKEAAFAKIKKYIKV